MISLENQYGTIEISQEYFANLVGRAASECFGVVGMISSPTQGIRSIMNGGKDVPDKGVHVRTSGGGLIVDLHIAVVYGDEYRCDCTQYRQQGALYSRAGDKP